MESQDTMRDQLMASLDATASRLAEYLPALLGAIALLVMGFLVAKLLGFVVRNGSKRLGVDRASRYAA